MALHTRRMLVFLSTLFAGVGVLWHSGPSFGVPVDAKNDKFIPNPKNPTISFTEARGTVAAFVQREIKLSQKDFKVEYSPQQIERIQGRVWNQAYLGLVQYYRPSELP